MQEIPYFIAQLDNKKGIMFMFLGSLFPKMATFDMVYMIE